MENNMSEDIKYNSVQQDPQNLKHMELYLALLKGPCYSFLGFVFAFSFLIGKILNLLNCLLVKQA